METASRLSWLETLAETLERRFVVLNIVVIFLILFIYSYYFFIFF